VSLCVENVAIAAYMLGEDEVSADVWSRAHAEWLRHLLAGARPADQ
jgi:hypothetical protein